MSGRVLSTTELAVLEAAVNVCTGEGSKRPVSDNVVNDLFATIRDRDKTIADYEGTISRLDHENHVMGEALNVIARGTAELNGHKHPLAVIAQEALALIADKGDE